MFLGICRVHRAQLLQVRGEWARGGGRDRARVLRTGGDEHHRCRSRASTSSGRSGGCAVTSTAPSGIRRGAPARVRSTTGLALAWSARGQPPRGARRLAGCGSGHDERLTKTRLWEAVVDVAVETGDLAIARRACDELQAAAETYASSGLLAAAALAQGRVQFAEGASEEALHWLTTARQRWQQLGAPMRVAQTRTLLSKVHLALGNEQAAALERGRRRCGAGRPGRSSPSSSGRRAAEWAHRPRVRGLGARRPRSVQPCGRRAARAQ